MIANGDVMQRLLRIVSKLSKWMNKVAGVALIFMILITVADVTLRSFRRPIIGTYELVALSGAVIIGFSIPLTSWLKGHIYVDFFILKLPQKGRKIFNIVTKCLGIGLFLIIGSNLMIFGMELHKAGEVSPTLHVPFYPIIYGIGGCCFFQCFVLFCDIVKIFGEEYE
jgi:TRAP-type C4-dicarboxylate transport system permease small subunit